MTTKLAVVEELINRAAKYATERKLPYHGSIPELRKKVGTALLASEIEARVGPAYDAGALRDYVDKEFLSFKASALLASGGSEASAAELAKWEPTTADREYAVDTLRKILLVMRS